MLCSQGFDEFMNVVVDEAEEVWIKQSRKPANDDSGEDSKANGAQTSKTKKQYGDRRTLGGWSLTFWVPLVAARRLGTDSPSSFSP